MKTVVFAPTAFDRLIELFAWTVERFGEAQAEACGRIAFWTVSDTGSRRRCGIRDRQESRAGGRGVVERNVLRAPKGLRQDRPPGRTVTCLQD